MTVDTEILESLFADFVRFLKEEKGESFITFKSSAFVNKDENYKYEVQEKAKESLQQQWWKPEDVGTGRIQEKVLNAISAKPVNQYNWHKNNLIDWRKRDDFKKLAPNTALENTLFNFFKNKIKDSQAFEEFLNIGLSYQLIAYFYFTKHRDLYLPITQERFDEIFVLIGLPEFKTSGRASWDNYSAFINITKQVRDFLKTKDAKATLLDAHTFLYILGSQMREANFPFSVNNAMAREQPAAIASEQIAEESLIHHELPSSPVEVENAILEGNRNRNTYLFAWNPQFWPWDELESNIQKVYGTGTTYVEDWSCGQTKSIMLEDRFFLVKLGTDIKALDTNVKGIIGSGTIVREPYLKKSIQDPSKETLHVDLKFDNLLNPYMEDILSFDILKAGELANQHWSPQSSGISVKPELVDKLEEVWFNFFNSANIRHNPFLPNNNPITYSEGVPYQVTQTVYERSPHARKACIEKYGLSCFVCRFNFAKVYGDIGKDFIHVHHINHISKIGKSYRVDPITDLRPVCPNCHAMLHRQKEGMSIEELKSTLGPGQLRD
ncbi:HNH endonuclease [Segetibacter aerophilus]|uniref:HNH domain-containing protein n=1 Tax=Segetibacter aerophilus TaxID=670293 RepID=A0A512B8Q4_9BACT|nr:HNH endonuclease [Segetibacter aerophilus]GEO08323.1 hypothetical protein SAE01_08190 [Segetibacter aerophilus]